jgi:methionyl aminopeptidase
MITLKTANDISILREGGKRHAFILKSLVKKIKPGISTKELNDYADFLINEGGDKSAFLNYQPYGAKRPYPASLCVSINEEVVHGIPNESVRILKEGDIVSLDLGLNHKGLFTDAAVTVPVGKIKPELEKLLKVTKKALNEGIKVAKGGATTGDIGNAIQKYADKEGYGIVRELAGHGVGYSVHEMPYVPNYGLEGKGEKLIPGMVIAIEPMFNMGTYRVILDKNDGYTYRSADGSPSAHFEHTVVITDGEPEILTA